MRNAALDVRKFDAIIHIAPAFNIHTYINMRMPRLAIVSTGSPALSVARTELRTLYIPNAPHRERYASRTLSTSNAKRIRPFGAKNRYSRALASNNRLDVALAGLTEPYALCM